MFIEADPRTKRELKSSVKQVRVSSRTFRGQGQGQGTDEGLPGQGQGTDEGLKHKQWLVSKVSGLCSLLSH